MLFFSRIFDTEFKLSHAVVLSANEVEEALLLGSDVEGDSGHRNLEKRGTSSTAWFGPRLGRKKRSLNSADDEFIDTSDSNKLNSVNRKNSNSADDSTSVAFLFKNYPWLVVPALSDGK